MMLAIKSKQAAPSFTGNALWHGINELSVADATLKNWLLHSGSLTERLQTHCRDFSVCVLTQRQQLATAEEYQQLDVQLEDQSQSNWQVREVILHGDNQPWVFARSVIPQTLCEQDFAHLGNRPLGQLIFNDDRFKRMPFQFICLQPEKTWLRANNLPDAQHLWGRRSVFRYQHLSMMVAEVFLPQSPPYHECIDEQ
ncbi:MAG: chorismate--pyruvate lyase [Paraglaciecola sp.]|jgi:chorismate--pyruvate lyase